MDFKIIGGPTPFNYQPDNDSAKLVDSGFESRVNIVRNGIRRQKEFDRFKDYLKTEGIFEQNTERKGSQKKRSSSKLRHHITVLDKNRKPIRVEVPSVDSTYNNSTEEKNNLIMVGGIAGYNEMRERYTEEIKSLEEFKNMRRKYLGGLKTFAQFSEEIKNSSKSEKRKRKLQKLKSDDQHWSGLEDYSSSNLNKLFISE